MCMEKFWIVGREGNEGKSFFQENIYEEFGHERVCSIPLTICKFPWPQNITGVRVWFGPMVQVSFAFSKTREMKPLRDLLKKDNGFTWSAALDSAFQSAHQFMADKVVALVRTFFLDRPTALVLDWSKSGVGFILLQKLCTSQAYPTPCAVWMGGAPSTKGQGSVLGLSPGTLQ